MPVGFAAQLVVDKPVKNIGRHKLDRILPGTVVAAQDLEIASGFPVELDLVGVGGIRKFGVVAVDPKPLQDPQHGQQFRVVEQHFQKHAAVKQVNAPRFTPDQAHHKPEEQHPQDHQSNGQGS